MREELFTDHMKEHDRKLREARKAEEKNQAAAFMELLKASVFIKVSLPLVSAAPVRHAGMWAEDAWSPACLQVRRSRPPPAWSSSRPLSLSRCRARSMHQQVHDGAEP